MGKQPAFAFARRMSALASDVKYAWRQARAAPTFSTIVVATLAVAIGLTTATYSAVDHVLLRPMVFPDADRLVIINTLDSARQNVVVISSANWLDLKNDSQTLDHTAIYQGVSVGLRSDEGAVQLPGLAVSGDFFATLRPRFLVGAAFTEQEVNNRGGGIVVSERLWKRYLASDSTLSKAFPGIAGTLPVVGVVADGFEFPSGTDVWIGVPTPPEPAGTRNNINWRAIARLKPGVSPTQAELDLGRVSETIRQSDASALYAYGVHLVSLQESIVGEASAYMYMLLSAVLSVLLIACANVATANVGRVFSRTREFAVRSALGAERSRIFWQLITEQLLLAAAGGALGVLLAWVALRGVTLAWGNEIPRVNEIHLDLRILAAATGFTVLSGVLAGVVPAMLASGATGAASLRSGSRGAARGGRNIPGAALVGMQIALAMVLVCGSTLFIRSFQSLLSRDLGFGLNVVTVEATLNARAFRGDTARQMAYWKALRDTVRQIPGVRHVGLANWTPLASAGSGSLEIAERPEPTMTTSFRVISDDYLETLGVTLVEGRMLGARDDRSGEMVAVISELVAKHYWPGESAIGKLVRSPTMEANFAGGAPWRRVVGVVHNMRHYGFEDEAGAEMYVPVGQASPHWIPNMTVVASGVGDPARMLPAIASASRAVNRAVAVVTGTMGERARALTASRRMVVTLLSVFGAVALLLAALGTYGLLSYGVAQRGREMAVRSALGATRSELMRLVFGGVGRIVLTGLAAGVGGALFLSRLVESQLVDISRTDTLAFAVSVVVVSGTALLATWVPARRAGRADPADALRGE